MEFTGTVFFDFESADCFRLFALLEQAAAEGVALDVEWAGFPLDGPGDASDLSPGVRALAAHAVVKDPPRRHRLRQALFALVHRHGDSLEDELTFRAAAKVAGLDGDVLLEAIPDLGLEEVRSSYRRGRAAHVAGVPTIVRDASPLLVTTTPAIRVGSARARLQLIDQMLNDDGMWGMVKP